MWTADKSLNAELRSRPIRMAYLIPENPPPELLDQVFFESMSRWGGRRTPIIIATGEGISEADSRFLKEWDPDLIYSFVRIDENRERLIRQDIAPAHYIDHDLPENPELPYDVAPKLHDTIQALTVTSILPRISGGSSIAEVLDRERGTDVDRDLKDSFGFLSDVISDWDISSWAIRASFCPLEHQRTYAPRFRGDKHIRYIRDVSDLETSIASARIFDPARMSDMYCPYMRRSLDWDDRLTIVVGDSTKDRLLYWNGIHTYSSLDDRSPRQIIRVSPSRLSDGLLPKWLRTLCGGQCNTRHLGTNKAPHVALVSSYAIDHADAVVAQLKDDHVLCSVEMITEPIAPYQKKERSRSFISLSSSFDWSGRDIVSRLKFRGEHFDVALNPPAHLQQVRAGAPIIGSWAIEMLIDRAEDHSRYYNHSHVWLFPKRLRIDQEVKIENYGPKNGISPGRRPTNFGLLSIFDNVQWQRPTVYEPRDLRAFASCLSHLPPERRIPPQDAPRNAMLRFEVQLSDKGRDLLGLLQHFRSLPEALNFLNNKCVRQIILNLSPSEASDKKHLVEGIARKVEAETSSPEPNFTAIAKSALQAASRTLIANFNSTYATYLEMRNWLPKEQNNNEGRSAFEHCVTYLRDRGALHQGFGWRCEICQHHNWVHLQDLRPVSKCDVCRQEQSSPVSGLHLRLNPFFVHAFSSTSAQDTVVWCIARLFAKAKDSFSLIPSLEIKCDKRDIRTDIDVLASVDGVVYAAEVKRSLGGALDLKLDALEPLMDELRPDVFLLAINESVSAETRSELAAKIEPLLSGLGVRFEILTPDRPELDAAEEAPLPYAKEMTWSAW